MQYFFAHAMMVKAAVKKIFFLFLKDEYSYSLEVIILPDNFNKRSIFLLFGDVSKHKAVVEQPVGSLQFVAEYSR
ncbi:MAG TPA: hypothetical protein PLL71_05540 [Agriterribacter sp.]|nr:hypothetical protein [Agriterribacter sp.]